MPRPWVVALACIIVTLLVVLLMSWSTIAAFVVFAPFGALLIWALALLYPRLVSLLPNESAQKYFGIRLYLKQIIKDHSKMPSPRSDPVEGDARFQDLFCDLACYQVNQQDATLSQWVSRRMMGRRPVLALLLGQPGAGKSVTVQAVLLSCANSYFLQPFVNHAVTDLLISVWHLLRSRRWRRGAADPIDQLRWLWRWRRPPLFHPSWVVPAPPYVPILIRLRRHDDKFRAYLSTKDRSVDLDEKALKLLLHFILAEECDSIVGEQLDELINYGRVAFLFDGLDELLNQANRLAALELVSYLWKRTIDIDRPNLLLVTCRRGTFNAELRDALPDGYEDVRLDTLKAADKRQLVARSIEDSLDKANEGYRKLLASARDRLKKPFECLFDPSLGPHTFSEQELVADLVTEIVERFPRPDLAESSHSIFPSPDAADVTQPGDIKWDPTDYPLSLRRITHVLLSRSPEEHLTVAWDPGEPRPQWRLVFGSFGSSVAGYAEIIREDLVELIRRRAMFVGKDNPDNIMRHYGELACRSYPSYLIGENELKALLGKVSRNRNKPIDQEDIDNFVAPHILTPALVTASQVTYTFRDRESGHFLGGLYMVNSPQAWEVVDNFYQKHGRSDDARVVLSMAFSQLTESSFQQVVDLSQCFTQGPILEELVSSRMAEGPRAGFQQREAEMLLKRCLKEIAPPGPGANPPLQEEQLLRLWCLTRYIVFFERDLFPLVLQQLPRCLDSPGAPAMNRAQTLLVLAEIGHCFDQEAGASWIVNLLERHLQDCDTLVRACAALGLKLLSPSRLSAAAEREALTLLVVGGEYRLGGRVYGTVMEDDQPVKVPTFRFARFPVLRFEWARWRKEDLQKLKPGEAFKPVTEVTETEAEQYAADQRGRLPSAAQFEVVASYSGGSGAARAYPWGDSFGSTEESIAFREREFRKRFEGDWGVVLAVGLKPALATPSGVYDLEANLCQYTDTRSASDSPSEEDVWMFGPSTNEEPELYRCIYFMPVNAEQKHAQVGFRLAWDVAEGDGR